MSRVQARTPQLAAGSTIVIACASDGGELADRLRASLDLGAHRVVVDLGAAEMVDASTLTALKRLAERLRSRGGRLSVVCRSGPLASLLDLTLLNRSFAVFPTIDAALDPALDAGAS